MRMKRGLAKDESGATGIEYAALALGLGLALMAALPLLRDNLEARFDTLAASLENMNTADGPGARLAPSGARHTPREMAARPSAAPADGIITSSMTMPEWENSGKINLREGLGAGRAYDEIRMKR